MNILAVDQARNGAWSVFDYDAKKFVTASPYSFASKEYTYPQMILETERLLDELVKKYDIRAVYIEDVQLRINAQVFKKLSQLQGVLINYLEKNELTYGIIQPTKWQSYCFASDKLSEELQEYANHLTEDGVKDSKMKSLVNLRRLLGMTTDNDNLADAILIGYYVVNKIKIKERK